MGTWSLASFGCRASLIAMPVLALQQTGSTWTVGLVAGAGGVPAITAPWWTGPFQRRLRTAGSLAWVMLGEGLAALIVPATAAFGRLSAATMIAAGLLIGVLGAVSGPLNASLLAAVGDRVDRRRMAAGQTARNAAAQLLALQDTAVKVAMTVAPLVTLPLLGVAGATWAVAGEGILTVCAAGLLAGLKVSSASDDAGRRVPVRRLIARRREIAVGWTVRGVGCAAWFAFTLGLPLLGEAHGSGVVLAAVGLTSYSAGAVLGSGLGVLTASSRRPALVNALSWLIAGVAWVVMGLAPHLAVIAGAAAVMGLAVPPGNAATTAMVTRSFSGLERRAALTGQATVVTGASTLGMLLGGPLIGLVGARAAIVLAGVVVAGAAATAAVTAYRRSRSTGRTSSAAVDLRVSDDRESRGQRELSRL